MFKNLLKIFQRGTDTSNRLASKKRTSISRVSHLLRNNIAYFESKLANTPGITYRSFQLASKDNRQAALVYIEGLVEKQLLEQQVLKPLMLLDFRDEKHYSGSVNIEDIARKYIRAGSFQSIENHEDLLEELLSGMVILLLDNADKALSIKLPGWEKRTVEEPDNEKVIRGPKEGFVENIMTNVSLIQRRIRDANLKCKTYSLGRRSRTTVYLLYMEDIMKADLLDELDARIQTIDTDMIYDTATVEAYIEDNPYSPFPQILPTERPDRAAANLLEGRGVILVDGSPFALVMPVTLATIYQSPEDYYERFLYGSAVRVLRLVSFFIGTTLPALYISFISFHVEYIPSRLILTLAKGRILVPFPAFIEALLMELTIELLREASARLPGPLGQTIGIVGALVLGQAAVSAQLVSPAMIIVVALTAMATFTVPLYSLSYPLRLVRFPLMLLAAGFGVFGIFAGWSALLIHLCTLESFGTPYMSPFAPFKLSDMKDALIRVPIWAMRKRSRTPRTEDVQRIGNKKGDHARD